MTTHRIDLSFTKPPLSMNDRMHWAAKAKITKTIRHEVATRARAANIGPQDHITVTLHYQPRDKRRRDRGNLLGTHKPCLDGLVDAGVVPDDDPTYVDERMPEIHPPVKGEPPHMWLTITTERNQP